MGAVACLGLIASGCAGSVEVDSPELTGAAAEDCRTLVDSLPDRVADQDRREVTPADGFAAAWGDPAIVLRCGVPQPSGFDEFATCQVVNDVGWYVPEEQIERGAGEIVMTTIGFAQNVQVMLPAEYWPPATAMVDLSASVKQSLEEIQPCV